MKIKNKGGRPTKSLIEKRTYRVNLKMNPEEYYTLKARASEARISACDFIRAAVLKAEIRQRLSPEAMEHIRKLSGMANNLNQIAHRANVAGYRDTRMEYLFLADKIDDLLNRLRQ
ncbi:MAG: MobC family plasmid mobilization relaxosome protein [Bacteroidales bacterium]|nr:MobC family plasmid mobilization relaxosome protein [Bacteroidales bacterium]